MPSKGSGALFFLVLSGPRRCFVVARALCTGPGCFDLRLEALEPADRLLENRLQAPAKARPGTVGSASLPGAAASGEASPASPASACNLLSSARRASTRAWRAGSPLTASRVADVQQASPVAALAAVAARPALRVAGAGPEIVAVEGASRAHRQSSRRAAPPRGCESSAPGAAPGWAGIAIPVAPPAREDRRRPPARWRSARFPATARPGCRSAMARRHGPRYRSEPRSGSGGPRTAAGSCRSRRRLSSRSTAVQPVHLDESRAVGEGVADHRSARLAVPAGLAALGALGPAWSGHPR